MEPVISLSALRKAGIAEFWAEVEKFRAALEASGEFASKRQHQALAWMWERIDTGLREAFRTSPQVREVLPAVQEKVRLGQLAASTAARQLLQRSEIGNYVPAAGSDSDMHHTYRPGPSKE